jgi:hypothetical protein
VLFHGLFFVVYAFYTPSPCISFSWHNLSPDAIPRQHSILMAQSLT